MLLQNNKQLHFFWGGEVFLVLSGWITFFRGGENRFLNLFLILFFLHTNKKNAVMKFVN